MMHTLDTPITIQVTEEDLKTEDPIQSATSRVFNKPTKTTIDLLQIENESQVYVIPDDAVNKNLSGKSISGKSINPYEFTITNMYNSMDDILGKDESE